MSRKAKEEEFQLILPQHAAARFAGDTTCADDAAARVAAQPGHGGPVGGGEHESLIMPQCTPAHDAALSYSISFDAARWH